MKPRCAFPIVCALACLISAPRLSAQLSGNVSSFPANNPFNNGLAAVRAPLPVQPLYRLMVQLAPQDIAAIQQAEAAADQRAHHIESADKSAPPANATVTLPAGSSVSLVLRKEVTSSTESGQAVELKLGTNLVVDGKMVAKAGTKARGEVVWSIRKTAKVGPGVVDIRFDYLQVGKKKVYLKGDSLQIGTLNAKHQVPVSMVAAKEGNKKGGILVLGKKVFFLKGDVFTATVARDTALPPLN